MTIAQATFQPVDRPATSTLVATTPFVTGYRVAEVKGEVFGLVVRSRGLGKNIMAGLRSIGGGRVAGVHGLLEQSREQAIERLIENARHMGANGVLSMRFDSSSLADYMSEIVAYGTAVVLVPDDDATRPILD